MKFVKFTYEDIIMLSNCIYYIDTTYYTEFSVEELSKLLSPSLIGKVSKVHICNGFRLKDSLRYGMTLVTQEIIRFVLSEINKQLQDKL